MSAALKTRVDGTGRECTGCGEYKPWAAYSEQADGTHGHRSRCRTCDKLKSARYYGRKAAAIIEYNRAWAAENQGARKAHSRKWRARTDRPCAYAGCASLAVAFDVHCRDHKNQRNQERYRRNQARLQASLHAAQDGCCAHPLNGGCGLPIDLACDVVHIDHRIPLAAAGGDAAYYEQLDHERNLQLLHEACNLRKRARMPAVLYAIHDYRLAVA